MSTAPLISIVDDDGPAREAVVSLVKALGFATADFQSAADFLRSDKVSRTACIVADMRMPAMSGLELHRHLAVSGIPIPVVLMTAYPDQATRAQALTEGVQCFLARPFEPDDLLACIRAALDGPT